MPRKMVLGARVTDGKKVGRVVWHGRDGIGTYTRVQWDDGVYENVHREVLRKELPPPPQTSESHNP